MPYSYTSRSPPSYQPQACSYDYPNERTRLFATEAEAEAEPQRHHSKARLSTVKILPCTIITCILALSVSFAAYSLIFPLTRCNDPLDPLVRDRIRKEWAGELQQHEVSLAERNALRLKWGEEDATRDQVREQWTHEVENHNRAERERRQREADERLRLGMFWTDVVGDHLCAAYATREYSARLTNVPEGYPHRVEACIHTPVVIHGVTYENPARCVDEGLNGLFGYWLVSHNEPACSTFWERYRDKGCTAQGSGKRRIEQYLANLPEGADWQEFCATTPAAFRGQEYKSPDHCFRANPIGAYGLWDIDDAAC
ncbi:hypothetical protein BJ138DRAFT_1162228 [Hygrophoropsis aurantiaca]|uniref:Uncharacterized protein n=1 Tax=Hygrophoropsis aurantiaca TaxID=72124 RepID=A0ACB8A0U3_9AGAM|nr:hypothetical protein BJ138DRAFT_1162228 [Hygrophoropsis aurantiaca]